MRTGRRPKIGWETITGTHTTLDDLAKTHLLGMGGTVFEALEHPPLVEVGRVDRVGPAPPSSATKAWKPSVWPCA